MGSDPNRNAADHERWVPQAYGAPQFRQFLRDGIHESASEPWVWIRELGRGYSWDINHRNSETLQWWSPLCGQNWRKLCRCRVQGAVHQTSILTFYLFIVKKTTKYLQLLVFYQIYKRINTLEMNSLWSKNKSLSQFFCLFSFTWITFDSVKFNSSSQPQRITSASCVY